MKCCYWRAEEATWSLPLGYPVVEEGKHLSIRVFWLLNEKGMIEFEYHHFVTLNEDALCFGDCWHHRRRQALCAPCSLVKGIKPESSPVSGTSHQCAGDTQDRALVELHREYTVSKIQIVGISASQMAWVLSQNNGKEKKEMAEMCRLK